MSATVVIKLGGEVVASAHMAAIAADVAEMQARGERVVVVHGGGPQATELQKKLGQTPKIVAGRRITDAETLDVMKMIVAGKVNVDACAALVAAGARPVGLHGASALAVEAVKRPPRVVTGGGPEPIDFGHVGDVTGVNEELLGLLSGAGYVPVIACLGADAAGNVYNINADVVANQLAMAAALEAVERDRDSSVVRLSGRCLASFTPGRPAVSIVSVASCRSLIPVTPRRTRPLSECTGLTWNGSRLVRLSVWTLSRRLRMNRPERAAPSS